MLWYLARMNNRIPVNNADDILLAPEVLKQLTSQMIQRVHFLPGVLLPHLGDVRPMQGELLSFKSLIDHPKLVDALSPRRRSLRRDEPLRPVKRGCTPKPHCFTISIHLHPVVRVIEMTRPNQLARLGWVIRRVRKPWDPLQHLIDRHPEVLELPQRRHCLHITEDNLVSLLLPVALIKAIQTHEKPEVRIALSIADLKP